jgi:DNA invertase Pin-like site-specific DNA recombinase
VAALEYLRPGDTLVVWKLDRLARSMRQLIETVEDFQEHGIELRSFTESIDTATPGGRLIFHIFGALAEFEQAVIRERTSAGLQAAKERGKKGGRPRSFGPKEIAAAKAMLADPDITVEDVAARLKVSSATFYRHFPGGRSALLIME